MLTLSQIPPLFRGELYETLVGNDPTDNTMIPHTLKTDFTFNHLGDILQCIDTCYYMGCDSEPVLFAVFDCLRIQIVQHLNTTFMFDCHQYKMGKKYQEYEAFMHTPEYKAVEVYIRIMYSGQSDFWKYSCAIENDSIIVYHYLVNHDTCPTHYHDHYVSTQFILIACAKGSINLLKHWSTNTVFIKQVKSREFGCQMCARAAANGDLTLLRFLRETMGVDWRATTLYAVVDQFAKGDRTAKTECFRYAVQNGCPTDHYIMSMLVYAGLFEEMKILREAGGSLNDPMYTLKACDLGRLDILQYLHEQGAPWNVNCVANCTTEECQRYAIQHGAPIRYELREITDSKLQTRIQQYIPDLL